MPSRWFFILLLMPWIGGCAATNLVTPTFRVGSSTVTLLTDLSPPDPPSTSLAAAETGASNPAIGLQSTLRF